MKFPVDLLADVGQAELERLAQEYFNSLLYRNPDDLECLTLSDSTEVPINISSVGLTPLYGCDKSRILGLFWPSDSMFPIALYLLDRWWTVEDILKTADPARQGLLPVDTVGERIVLYVLNRVIYRVKERSSEEIPFLCHGENDLSKILWDDGEAVGFYSAKAKGSFYSRFSSRTYELPVMDSIFVTKRHRGKGSGLLMLKDFVHSFGEDSLGLKYPLSRPMYRVCEKYLSQYPEDSDLLWEVERSGAPNQRTNIASKIQVMDLSAVSKRLSFIEQSQVIGDVSEATITKRKKEVTEYTEEIVEETTVLRTTRDGHLGGTGLEENITEDHSEKVIRIEHIEAEAPREEQVCIQETETLDLQTEGLFDSEESGEDTSNVTPVAEEAVSLSKSHRDLGSRDSLELPPATEEDETTQDELVASQDPPEDAQEDPAALVVSQEVLEVHSVKRAEQGRILRTTTILSTTVERNYKQQRTEEETEEEDPFSLCDTAQLGGDVVEEMGKGEKQRWEDEELENEEQTEKKGAVPQEISAEHPDPAELEKGHASDHLSDEAEEPPVVQMRGPRGRRKVHPKPKSTTQEDKGKQAHEEELKAGRSSGGTEEVDEQMDEEKQEDPSNDRRLAEKSSTEFLLVLEDDRPEGAEESEEGVITSTEVRIEIKEVERETAGEVVSEKEEPADDGALKTDVISADDLDQPTVSVPEGLDLTKHCELPSLQHASVILVDLKTNNDYLSVVVERETSEAPCFTSETGEVELIAAEAMDQTPESASTGELEELVTGKGMEDSPNQDSEEEEAPETIHLRSGRKIVKVDQEHEDTAAGRRSEEDHEAEIVPDEAGEEKETVSNDGAPAEEETTEEASTQPDVNEEMRLEDEAPTNLQPSTEATEETAACPEVDEGPMPSPKDQENTAGSSHPDTAMASNPKEASGASEEKQHSEDVALQESDLQRVTVVLMELRSSSQSQPPAETEEDTKEGEQPEAAPDAPGNASDVSEEAVTPTLLSGEDGEAEGGSGVEEVPVVESRVLRSGRKMRYTRTPRRGRRSAAATPMGKPRRAHANSGSEEEAADETIPTLEEQREEPKPDLEGVTQKDPSTEGEVKEGVDVAQEEEALQPHCGETEEPSQDEPAVIARVLRKAKRSAPATPIRRSKRSRLQPKSEEGSSAEDRDTGGTTTDDGEVPEIKNGDEEKSEDMDVVSPEATTEVDPEPRPNGAGETSPRETAGELQTVVADEEEEEAPAPGTKSLQNQMEENEEEAGVETSSGPDKPGRTEGEVEELAEEETEKVVDRESAEPEDVRDDPPAEAPEAERQKAPEGSGDAIQLSSSEEDTDGDLPHRKDESPEDEAEAEDDADFVGGPSGFSRAVEPEVESDVEDEKESDSEEEEDVSGDEPIVMGKKVLRGRTVPALIITPRPKGRRSKGLLSDEKSPQSARKEKLKRKRTEATPDRKSKRRSRLQP